jgi:phosphatidylglycerophosphate synthase
MEPDRRPLASRNTGWARRLARWLVVTQVTPNQISAASLGFAALAGGAFWAAGATEGWARAGLLVAAALGCQLRLLCNLLDGMVAIEGGRQAPDGPFWNEMPDRIADILILAGLGLGAGAAALGWAAAALAVLTAYTREIGRAMGLASDFRGPMAKPQRMATVTVAALAAAVWGPWILAAALWIVVAGSALTVLRRSLGILAALRAR